MDLHLSEGLLAVAESPLCCSTLSSKQHIFIIKYRHLIHLWQASDQHFTYDFIIKILVWCSFGFCSSLLSRDSSTRFLSAHSCSWWITMRLKVTFSPGNENQVKHFTFIKVCYSVCLCYMLILTHCTYGGPSSPDFLVITFLNSLTNLSQRLFQLVEHCTSVCLVCT